MPNSYFDSNLVDDQFLSKFEGGPLEDVIDTGTEEAETDERETASSSSSKKMNLPFEQKHIIAAAGVVVLILIFCALFICWGCQVKSKETRITIELDQPKGGGRQGHPLPPNQD